VKARADCGRAAGQFEEEVPTVPNGTQRVGLEVDAAQAACAVRESSGVEVPRTVVMGLDQHRAQITAEWIDTETGEIARARVAPAHREGVRRFLRRFDGVRVEAALEATTGWRFVIEELCAIGAAVHLAEPRPAHAAATRSAPRPTARTPATCASC
jgi:hypothetical protein